ncbi:MAG: hypothetical protein IJ280_00855 [Bacteroidales bacterium]|nr:hypothetical protein [Bacteroidales bacterium]
MKNDMFIPDGNTIEDFKQRAKVIRNFYRLWKLKHPDQKVYNHSLKADINIRFISIDETSTKAAKNYLSTLAVLQLDVILMAAKKVRVVKPKVGVENQKTFKEMILMECDLVSIGKVKLTVGVHKKSSLKIQYCITAINVSP